MPMSVSEMLDEAVEALNEGNESAARTWLLEVDSYGQCLTQTERDHTAALFERLRGLPATSV